MDELGEIRAALMDAVIKIDALRDAAAVCRKLAAEGMEEIIRKSSKERQAEAEYPKKFNAFMSASRGVGRGERDIGKVWETEGEVRAYNKGVADGHSGAQVPGIGVWYYK